jgi:dihydrodipicolinate synthase/N-acetylneuraminate lyase
MTQALFEACVAKDWAGAEDLRTAFLPLEDQRDAWGPARVLHAAIELAGVAQTGPIPPFVTGLDERQQAELEPIARELRRRDREHKSAPSAARAVGR